MAKKKNAPKRTLKAEPGFVEAPPYSPPPSIPEEDSTCEDLIEAIEEQSTIAEPIIESATDVPQQPWTSPYRTAPVTLHFGPDEIQYYVPRHFLPAEWAEAGEQDQLSFPDIDIQTGHTLVHYLYKETYETPATSHDSPSLQARIKLESALMVYIATSNHSLAGLQQLAIHEIEDNGSNLNIFEVLETINDGFSKLGPNSWVHEYLQQRARLAFEKDHAVFTNKCFLQNLQDTSLIKFMARCALDLYNTRLCHILTAEGKPERRLDEQPQHARDQPLDQKTPVLEEDLVCVVDTADVLHVEECCVPPADSVEALPSEEFCTISSLSPEPVVCEAEAYPPEPDVESNHRVSDQTVAESCYEACDVPTEASPELGPVPKPEPEPEYCEAPLEATVEPMPDHPQPVECEPPWEVVETEAVLTPTEYNAIDDNGPVEDESMNISASREAFKAPRCKLQRTHILKGEGWKTCKRCRLVVNALIAQV